MIKNIIDTIIIVHSHLFVVNTQQHSSWLIGHLLSSVVLIIRISIHRKFTTSFGGAESCRSLSTLEPMVLFHNSRKKALYDFNTLLEHPVHVLFEVVEKLNILSNIMISSLES